MEFLPPQHIMKMQWKYHSAWRHTTFLELDNALPPPHLTETFKHRENSETIQTNSGKIRNEFGKFGRLSQGRERDGVQEVHEVWWRVSKRDRGWILIASVAQQKGCFEFWGRRETMDSVSSGKDGYGCGWKVIGYHPSILPCCLPFLKSSSCTHLIQPSIWRLLFFFHLNKGPFPHGFPK